MVGSLDRTMVVNVVLVVLVARNFHQVVGCLRREVLLQGPANRTYLLSIQQFCNPSNLSMVFVFAPPPEPKICLQGQLCESRLLMYVLILRHELWHRVSNQSAMRS